MGPVIGIDARAAAEVPAGRGRFVRELLHAFARRADGTRYRLYAREAWGDLPPDRFEWVLIPKRDVLWHMTVARRAPRETRAFLSTNSYLTAALSRRPMTVVVYDLVPFVVPDLARSRSTWIERATIRPAVRRADRLVCISQSTEHDLISHFPAATGKTRVAHLAADPLFGAPAADTPPSGDPPYVLAVGTLEPRKNLRRLLEAWQLIADDAAAGMRLVLVGPDGWGDAGLDRVAESPSVQRTGFVSEERLRELYAGCACFAYPSLYEGFGLPVLEAMAAGAPVVTSNISSMPEIAGDAALLVDPRSVEDIAQAISRVLADTALAARLRDRGTAHAAGFSWDRTAARVLDALLPGMQP